MCQRGVGLDHVEDISYIYVTELLSYFFNFEACNSLTANFNKTENTQALFLCIFWQNKIGGQRIRIITVFTRSVVENRSVYLAK